MTENGALHPLVLGLTLSPLTHHQGSGISLCQVMIASGGKIMSKIYYLSSNALELAENINIGGETKTE